MTPQDLKWATIATVTEHRAPIPNESAGGAPGRFRERIRIADSKPQLVATAKFIRQLLPGDQRYGDALSTTAGRAPDRIGRLVSEAQAGRPGGVRELSLGALQAWQALSEAQGRGGGTGDGGPPVP